MYQITYSKGLSLVILALVAVVGLLISSWLIGFRQEVIANSPPTATITSPSEGSFIGFTTTINVDANDDISVDRVEFYWDSINLIATDTVPPYSRVWVTSSAPEGVHTLTAKAYDYTGNSTVSSGVNITVDRTAPTVSLTSPLNGAVLIGPITIAATATDNASGINRVDFYRDGSILLGSDNTAPYELTWNPGTTIDGTHSLFARAVDNSGLATSSTNSAVTVAVVPSTVITSPASGSIVPRGRSTVINATAADNDSIATVKFYVNGSLKCTDMIAPYSCNWSVPNQRNRTYTLQTKAYDTTGNSEGVSTMVTVTSSN